MILKFDESRKQDGSSHPHLIDGTTRRPGYELACLS